MKSNLTLFAVVGLSLLALPSVAQTAVLKSSLETNLSAKCDTFIEKRLATVLHAKSKVPVSGWSSVILQIDGDLTPEREKALTALSADIYRRLPIISSAAIRIPTRNLKELVALPFVTRLSADVAVEKQDEFTYEHSGASTAYNDYGLSGWGVTVAVLDSGIASHKDLKDTDGYSWWSRVIGNVNFSSASGTSDKCGHGTHIAGIIGGNGNNSTGRAYYRTFYGIARDISLVNVRVLDENGSGSVSSVIAGLNWVIRNKAKYGIRVINLSLGHTVGESYKTDPLCQAAEAAYRAGIVVVCAAGNNGRLYNTQSNGNNDSNGNDSNEGWGSGYGSIQSPGNDPYVITVGATKEDANNSDDPNSDKIATYSSRGPSRLDFVMKPDIVAPGNRVISLNWSKTVLDSTIASGNVVPLSYYVRKGSDAPSRQYIQMSGTSMAAPVVTGAVALMLEQDWTLTPDTIKARLMVSADKPKGKADPCTYGAGFLDIPGALNSTITATAPAMTPWLAVGSGNKVVVNGTQVIWGGNGKPAIWGIEGIDSLQIIWGKGVKDLQTVQGTQVIWGGVLPPLVDLTLSTVWGDQVIWGGGDPKVDLSNTALSGEQ